MCFKLYDSRDPSIHSMAGVAIRQIVSALFERVSKSTEDAYSEGVELGEEPSMPSHTRDAYLLFQVSTWTWTVYVALALRARRHLHVHVRGRWRCLLLNWDRFA